MSKFTHVVCEECGTNCGGAEGKDTYSHMLGCLKVQPGAIDRIRESALSSRTENGKRVVHLCDALLVVDPVPTAYLPDF